MIKLLRDVWRCIRDVWRLQRIACRWPHADPTLVSHVSLCADPTLIPRLSPTYRVSLVSTDFVSWSVPYREKKYLDVPCREKKDLGVPCRKKESSRGPLWGAKMCTQSPWDEFAVEKNQE